MAKEFFSGRTLQQAILAAARRFAVAPEELAYLEREKTGGFIKNPKVVIEVDPAAPRRRAKPSPAAPPTAAPRPAPPRAALPTSRPERGAPQPAGDPRTALPLAPEAIGVLARLGRLDIGVEGRVGATAQELELELSGADAAKLAQDDGELLEAVEHLVPRVLRGLGAGPVFCRVDAVGFRAEREARLRELALEAAERVRREGRPVSLPELPPAERRIVHLTLEGDPSVTTESLGEGFRKVVVVRTA